VKRTLSARPFLGTARLAGVIQTGQAAESAFWSAARIRTFRAATNGLTRLGVFLDTFSVAAARSLRQTPPGSPHERAK
jgi:hypothetical protein